MPPAAATECERTGCTLLNSATDAPASAAASAARWPARPAPMMRRRVQACSLESIGPGVSDGVLAAIRDRAPRGVSVAVICCLCGVPCGGWAGILGGVRPSSRYAGVRSHYLDLGVAELAAASVRPREATSTPSRKCVRPRRRLAAPDAPVGLARALTRFARRPRQSRRCIRLDLNAFTFGRY